MKKAAILLIAILAVSFSSGTIYAKPSKDQKIEHADRNKDGQVGPKEMKWEKKWEQKQKAQVNKPWEKKADKNKDGVVQPVEAKQANQKFKDKLDLNNDGVVDPKERRSQEAWTHYKSKVNTTGERRYDLNNDGWIDSTEAEQMMKDRQIMAIKENKPAANTSTEQVAASSESVVAGSAETGTP